MVEVLNVGDGGGMSVLDGGHMVVDLARAVDLHHHEAVILAERGILSGLHVGGGGVVDVEEGFLLVSGAHGGDEGITLVEERIDIVDLAVDDDGISQIAGCRVE